MENPIDAIKDWALKEIAKGEMDGAIRALKAMRDGIDLQIQALQAARAKM